LQSRNEFDETETKVCKEKVENDFLNVSKFEEKKNFF